VTRNVISAILALFLLEIPNCAAAGQASTCIGKATEALPKIGGLQVNRSIVRPMPPEHLANWKGRSKPIIVDIEAKVLGLNERYSYLCAVGPNGAAFVQRTAN
jgi:hypothetical protein